MVICITDIKVMSVTSVSIWGEFVVFHNTTFWSTQYLFCFIVTIFHSLCGCCCPLIFGLSVEIFKNNPLPLLCFSATILILQNLLFNCVKEATDYTHTHLHTHKCTHTSIHAENGCCHHFLTGHCRSVFIDRELWKYSEQLRRLLYTNRFSTKLYRSRMHTNIHIHSHMQTLAHIGSNSCFLYISSADCNRNLNHPSSYHFSLKCISRREFDWKQFILNLCLLKPFSCRQVVAGLCMCCSHSH